MISNALVVILLLVAAVIATFAQRDFRQRRWKRFALFAVPMALCLILGLNALPGVPFVGTWLQHGAYRTGTCEREAPLVAMRIVTRADGGETNSGRASCAVEFVVNDTSKTAVLNSGLAAKDCWTAADATLPSARNCYTIATLEFDDQGALSYEAQLDQLRLHFIRLKTELYAKWSRERAARPDSAVRDSDVPGLYLIAYVHGWRNDARPTNGDFRRLRIMVSAASRDLAARCRIAHRFCNTAAVGLFLGWRGSVGFWDAGSDETDFRIKRIGQIVNFLTFQGRKEVSDGLGFKMMDQLRVVRRMMGNNFPRGSANALSSSHLLLIGHSLGGNVVLSGVSVAVPTDDRIGLPSDLAVIINPATETRKWVDVWRKVRTVRWPAQTPPRLVFLMSPPHYFGEKDEEPEAGRWTRLLPSWFNRWTKPAAKKAEDMAKNEDEAATKRAAEELNKDRELAAAKDYDTVVDGAFWYSQFFSRWPSSGCPYAMEINGLGHMPVDGSPCQAEMTDIYTHFVEVNYSLNTDVSKASYANAADPARSCFIEPGFLACARSRGTKYERRCGDTPPSGSEPLRWDFGALNGNVGTLGLVRNVTMAPESLFEPYERAKNRQACVVPKRMLSNDNHRLRNSQQINVQIGTGPYPERPMREQFNPMWGIRAFPQSLIDHSGFWTAPYECFFNKLVLDDPVAAISRPSHTNVGEKWSPPDRYKKPISATDFIRTLDRSCKGFYPR
jgi:hypothetical protein